jgi:hypothetical protein
MKEREMKNLLIYGMAVKRILIRKWWNPLRIFLGPAKEQVIFPKKMMRKK